MEDLDNRNALGLGAVDQFLQPLDEGRHVRVAIDPKGLLNVDYQ